MAVEPFEEKMRRGGGPATEQASRFFMGDDPVHNSMRKIAQRLDALTIPYAIAGGLALGANGYLRNTVNVDLLVAREDLTRIVEAAIGNGYVKASGRTLRDLDTGVAINFLVSGDFPGDGKSKPVVFPDPHSCAFEKDGLRFVSLSTLLELKIVAGMHSGRMRHLADAMELIACRGLDREYSQQLHSSVREKFLELWQNVQMDPVNPDVCR